MTAWPDEVLHFWFSELQPDDWFSGRQEIDAAIEARFGGLRAELKSNPPPAEKADNRTLLATVIVLDQFSRNIWRGSAEAYATDELALRLAHFAVDGGLDKGLQPNERQFLYMPFMHSEDAAMQARSVELFGRIEELPDLLGHAMGHRKIIDRFGRFPHRNAILGRASTEDELAFLDAESART